MVDLARRAWLQGARKSVPPLRPPGAGPESAFSQSCSRCDECLRACPAGLLRRGQGGLPQLDPRRGACDFCGRCAAVCPSGALDPQLQPWPWRAALTKQCLAQLGITCRSCAEHCDLDALRFRPAIGGKALLEIDTERCNGCGACVGVCPNSALQLHNHRSTENTAHATGHR